LWRLEVDANGVATLSARVGEQLFVMDLRVDPDTEVMTMLAADLACAVQPADIPRVVGLRDALPDQAAVRKGPVEISVLGSLEIAGGAGLDAVESKRRRPALAMLAYMATHRHPVTHQDLARALWPLDTAKANLGGGAPSTVHNVVNHAKSILGRGPNGEELLICTSGGYEFTDGVTSAWARFLKMAAVADGEDALTRMGTWASALQLVRGVPLAGNYPGKYFEWFGSERLDDKIKTTVIDIAAKLAAAALEVEEWDTVKWAVDKGLELDPAREELFQILMHAEGRSGKPARVDQVYGQLCLMLQKQVDVLQTPSDESEEIWKSYTAAEGAGKR
jgi:DNA-binding SARP family transcriptional activator